MQTHLNRSLPISGDLHTYILTYLHTEVTFSLCGLQALWNATTALRHLSAQQASD